MIGRHPRGTAIAIGNFDGVHAGHQQLLTQLAAKAGEGRPAVVVSFYPHPAAVLGKAAAVSTLTSVRQKQRVFSTLGIDYLWLIHFTPAFSKVSAEEFVERVLIEALDAREAVLGPDTAVGRGREGTTARLAELLNARGCAVTVGTFLEIESTKVGSGMVRTLVEQGEVSRAVELLRRPYSIDGRIVRGDSRGKSIGFPTANIALRGQVTPRDGVYAGWLMMDGKRLRALVNIGTRPTFGAQTRALECHLVDYLGEDFYGKRVELFFAERIRAERKFASVAELTAQIQRDIDLGLKILLDRDALMSGI